MLGFIIMAAVAALSFAAVNFVVVRRKDPGTELMREIAGAIQEGADAFIWHEYRVIFAMAVVVAVLLAVVVSWYTGAAFLLGAVMSGSAGLVGMKIATIANVRVSNTARITGSLGPTLKVAFQGGSVMGLAVGGFALLGLALVYLVFGRWLGQTEVAQITVITNRIGINYIPFTMTVSGYALGCSIIAMFDRVGGGIYTKAADMGADLVGKTEAHIPEDDPRNPATIADNVGDNVGDVAGLGADLLESYVGSLIACVVLAAYMYHTQTTGPQPISGELVQRLMLFPLAFAAIGVLACIVGIFTLIAKKVSDQPHRELNVATWSSALLTLVGTGFFTWWYFGGVDLTGIGFRLGVLSPWLAAVAGILTGVLVGQSAEYYTSFSYAPTRELAAAAREGTALTITEGLSLGMRSVFAPVLLLALATITANAIAGLYGVAMAAIGMLSFVVATVSVDTYGPIADNAGGISEMSKLDPGVREITDHLDSVGNTTAAIGKGFAIGSAAFAALSLFSSYLFSQAAPDDTAGYELVLNMINTLTLAGALVGAVLPFLFSGILIRAVARAARKMVQEVRRQFAEIPGILSGTEKPDYKLCIEISSAGALAEMKLPALLAVLTPIVTGFLFGAEFVGGLLIGTTLSAIMLALFSANSGGAWDNGKKLIEQGYYGGKGSDAHDASVVGDTVGDPLKDTVGPSLDILIKIMAVVSLITVNIFLRYNLLDWVSGLW
ncbi:sodium-translocating pyrophosphatase [Spirochaeta africana]|uniref:Putative K(+)-stimulated pyrophosphate-energized sodium pump n=1 Tax=Spirochaeta africana (strain ATCC 700263 / DSM 8902 / Z-7692) TaxID=889378 RepID=H9UF92_SPIAZ|nr:sodium-translocating pyrophosphatase [Spirochaeta africana]AFG36185.1 vacuolar-type H(+)-translocating pyrophosphatase [Spirochaeta africana DSM 8902]